MMQGSVSIETGVRRVGSAGLAFDDRRGDPECAAPPVDTYHEGGMEDVPSDVFSLMQTEASYTTSDDDVSFYQSKVTVDTGVRRVGSRNAAKPSDERRQCQRMKNAMSTELEDRSDDGGQVVMMQGAVRVDSRVEQKDSGDAINRIGNAGLVFDDRRGKPECTRRLVETDGGEGAAGNDPEDVFSLVQTEATLGVGAAHSDGDSEVEGDHLSAIQSQVSVNRGERLVGMRLDEGQDSVDSTIGSIEIYDDEAGDSASMIQERVACSQPPDVPEEQVFDDTSFTQTTLAVESGEDRPLDEFDDEYDEYDAGLTCKNSGANAGSCNKDSVDDFTSLFQTSVTLGKGIRLVGAGVPGDDACGGAGGPCDDDDSADDAVVFLQAEVTLGQGGCRTDDRVCAQGRGTHYEEDADESDVFSL